MQKIQYPNSLPIGIHPPQTADKSQGPRPAQEEVGSCMCIRSLAVGPCIYRGDEESPRDLHKKHRAATRREETEKSAIAKHAWGQQHRILWEETSVLDQAKNNTTLLIKEALHIRLTNLELINKTRVSPFLNAGN